MALNEALLPEAPETVAIEMSEHMANLATAGEWAEVEALAVRIRSAVMNVPEAERREVLESVQRVTDKVIAEAESAHHELLQRLSGLRRGQVATQAYKLR